MPLYTSVESQLCALSTCFLSLYSRFQLYCFRKVVSFSFLHEFYLFFFTVLSVLCLSDDAFFQPWPMYEKLHIFKGVCSLHIPTIIFFLCVRWQKKYPSSQLTPSFNSLATQNTLQNPTYTQHAVMNFAQQAFETMATTKIIEMSLDDLCSTFDNEEKYDFFFAVAVPLWLWKYEIWNEYCRKCQFFLPFTRHRFILKHKASFITFLPLQYNWKE